MAVGGKSLFSAVLRGPSGPGSLLSELMMILAFFDEMI
jgi:hypothetical protein